MLRRIKPRQTKRTKEALSSFKKSLKRFLKWLFEADESNYWNDFL
jgi:hypothetical protein